MLAHRCSPTTLCVCQTPPAACIVLSLPQEEEVEKSCEALPPPTCVHGIAVTTLAVLVCPLPLPQEEEVEKSCEGCSGANLAHRLRHTLRRLPRVLVLHMKRFKVGGEAEVCCPLSGLASIPNG